jgi:hypothetical protein
MAANAILGRGYGAYVQCDRTEFGSLSRYQPKLCGLPTTLHLRTKFGMCTRSEARNRTCITVNSKIYVFAGVRWLADHVTPNFKRAEATSLANYSAKPHS